jgi:signal transduction histidine kinase/ActR/RegA family two-component response regulator
VNSQDYQNVWVVTPNSIDAELALAFLAQRGVAARASATLYELCAAMPAGPGCVVLVEEALVENDLHMLHQALAAQPPWSDVPLVLIAGEHASLEAMVERAFPYSGNITLLQRPINPVTLVSAVHVGLRARMRQLEVRDLLQQRDEALNNRDEFLAMLAHELRNPLAPIRNAVYLQQSLNIDDRMFVKTREIVGKQVTHLTRMLDDLLDVARLERGKVQLQIQRMDLNSLVASSMEAFQAVTQSRRHQVRARLAAVPLPVDADPVRVEQVLTNLLTNAAKFTPEGGVITVEARPDGRFGTVSVSDNGIGLKPEMLNAIFEPFAQGDQSLARANGGLGMGLTISRRIAELHGGKVEAESAGEDKGSTFVLRLPLAKGTSDNVWPAPDSVRSASPSRVVIVEDNPDIRESTRLILEMWGHRVLTTASGAEGIALVSREGPNVVLIDIGLPGLNGYEVAQAIRASRVANDKPLKLIAVTGYGQPADRERARDAGFDAHLLKPIDIDTLQRMLAEAPTR